MSYYKGIRRRGTKTERDLVELLFRINIVAVRMPVSGGGALRIYNNDGQYKDSMNRNYDNEPVFPDVIAVDEFRKQLLAFQVKDTKTKNKYINKEDLYGLRNFKILFDNIIEDIRLFIVVKFEGNNWCIKEVFDDTITCRVDLKDSQIRKIFEWKLKDILFKKEEK